MRIPILLLGISLSTAVITTIALEESSGQAFDIKPWHGEYPDMKGSYPLAFIALKGGLVPVPFLFVQLYPTKYYITIPSEIVFDGAAYSSILKTGLKRLVLKMFERTQMEGRYLETEKTRDYNQLRKDISRKIFDARSDELPDIYSLAGGFINLYGRIDRFEELKNTGEVRQILQKEADGLLLRFLMANVLDSDHGGKLEAFEEIRTELQKLSGETDYTYRKLLWLGSMGEDRNISYAFLKE